MPVGSYTAQHGSNVTHFPKVATDEGELSPHDYYEVSLPLVGLALGDGHIFYRLKDASRFLGAFLSLNDTGSSSGSTDVMLHNATDSADLLSAALSVAYDERGAGAGGRRTGPGRRGRGPGGWHASGRARASLPGAEPDQLTEGGRTC